MPRFSSQKSFEQVKNHRLLHERSNLAIEFPQSDRRIFRAQIPFLQNPIVSERGESNLVEYSLVGRAGNLYSYGGAKSRVITLQFVINLNHLLYTEASEGIRQKFFRQFNLFYADKERAKKAFLLRPGGTYDKAKRREEAASRALSAANEREARMGATLDRGKPVMEPDTQVDPATAGLTYEQREVYYEERYRERLEAYEAAEAGYADAAEAAADADQAAYEADVDLGDIEQDINYDPEFAEQNKNNMADLNWSKGFPHAQTHMKFYQGMVRLAANGKLDTGVQAAGQLFGSSQINKQETRTVSEGLNDEGEETFKTVDVAGSFENIVDDADTSRHAELINLVYVWLNLIRATTLNNARDTTQGPPVVRLTHGPMYNNVPFVVNDYNFEINQQAGYDIQTLTPKEIKISMTMKEYRSGRGTFAASQIEDGDNLAGWEAIIENNNIDPYNGEISNKMIETYGAQAKDGRGADQGLQDGARGRDDQSADFAAGAAASQSEFDSAGGLTAARFRGINRAEALASERRDKAPDPG